MELIGLWLADKNAVGVARRLGGQGFAVRRLAGPQDLTAELDGLVAEAGLLETHAAAVQTFREGRAPLSAPVIAILDRDADDAAVARALDLADETAREPVSAQELATRLRLLGCLRQALETLRERGMVRARPRPTETPAPPRPAPPAPAVAIWERLAPGLAQEISSPVQYVEGNLEFMANTFVRMVESLDRLSAVALDAAGDGERLTASLADLLGDEELRFLLEETPAAIRESREGLDRMTAIVQAVGRLARPDDHAPRAVDVGEALRDALIVSRSAWKYVADVTTDIEPDLPAVYFSPERLCRAVLLVLLDAADALRERLGEAGGKGRIAVSVRRGRNVVELVVQSAGPDGAAEEADETGREGRHLPVVRAMMDREGASVEVLAGPGGQALVILRLRPALGPVAIGA